MAAAQTREQHLPSAQNHNANTPAAALQTGSQPELAQKQQQQSHERQHQLQTPTAAQSNSFINGSIRSRGSDPQPSASSQSTLASPSDPCNHWMSGYCSWGLKCRFLHVVNSATRSSITRRNPEVSAPAAGGRPTIAEESHDLQDSGDSGSNHEGGTETEETYAEREARWVWRRPAARLWAHVFLHKRHPDFDFVPMLIGRNGHNTRGIFLATNAKLRIRGRGSGHLEVDCGNGRRREAPVPLMLAVTQNKTDPEGFRKAIEMTLARLNEVQEHYRQFCMQRGLPEPLPTEPAFSFGEISAGSEKLLTDLLLRHPHPNGPKHPKQVTPGGNVPAGLAVIANRVSQNNGAAPAADDATQPLETGRSKRVRPRAKHCKNPAEAAATAEAAAGSPAGSAEAAAAASTQAGKTRAAADAVAALPVWSLPLPACNPDYGNAGSVPHVFWNGFCFVAYPSGYFDSNPGGYSLPGPLYSGHFDSDPGASWGTRIDCENSYGPPAAGFGGASLPAQPPQMACDGSYWPHGQQIGLLSGNMEQNNTAPAAADPWNQVTAGSSPMWPHRVLPDETACDGNIPTREVALSDATDIETDYRAAVVGYLAGAESEYALV